MEKRTSLYEKHVSCGGKMVPFAGYLLPVEYPTGVICEHMAVREAAGLFDVSHMGEILFSGKGARDTINYLLTNDFTNLRIGQARYSPMCNREGGVVDDLLVYCLGEDRFLAVVNAANRDKDAAFMQNNLLPETKMEDISDSVSQIALQGPKAEKILAKIANDADIPKKYYSFLQDIMIEDMKCLISNTGYTGELGYEIYLKNADAPKLWDLLLSTGKDDGLIPCGLGARDTLRLEAAMPLYGHEMDEEVSPVETGLGFAVKMNKPDFIGKTTLKEKGDPTRTRVGLKVTGRGIVREHQEVFVAGKSVGMTTSGTFSPYYKYAIAMALIDVDSSKPGTEVEVDVRGRRVLAEIVTLPFYKRV